MSGFTEGEKKYIAFVSTALTWFSIQSVRCARRRPETESAAVCHDLGGGFNVALTGCTLGLIYISVTLRIAL